MITPEQVTALVKAMRDGGVRKLKAGDIELELGPPPQVMQRFDLEKREDDETRRKRHNEGYVYGSSY